MDGIGREEYNASMLRLHKRIDSMRESSIRIEESSKRTETSSVHIGKKVDELYEIMFGNEGREGVITKLSNLRTKVGYHWFLIGLILVGVFSTLGIVIVETIKRGG